MMAFVPNLIPYACPVYFMRPFGTSAQWLAEVDVLYSPTAILQAYLSMYYVGVSR